MMKNKKISRNIFLIIGVAVGLLIFILGSQLTVILKHAEQKGFKNVELKEPNLIIKKFFS